MAQIFDPLPTNTDDKIVCCYMNSTSQIQVTRITNMPNWYFERVVFPGQRLLFEAMSEAQLEIHTGMMASAILSDTIPCSRLQVHQDLSPTFNRVEEQECERRNDHFAVGQSRAEMPVTAVL
jgi:hypothetical protein